jgi:hypothetical protein
MRGDSIDTPFDIDLLQLLFSLLCSWTAAQVGAVQMHIADVMQILCGAGMASTGLIACAALGWEGVTTHPKVMAALSARHGDWMRAILVSFLALPYVAFLPLSVLNQAVRTRLWCGAAADKSTWVTPVVATQLHDMRAWNWSSVGPKAMRVALGFICIIVGLQKCLTLFFVWFITAVSSTPPGATLAIFVGTGVVRALYSRSAIKSGNTRGFDATICHLHIAGSALLDSLDGCGAAVPHWRRGHHRRVQRIHGLLDCGGSFCGGMHLHQGLVRVRAPPGTRRGA